MKNNELVIIEDNPGDYMIYVRLLEEENLLFEKITHLTNLKDGFEYLSVHTPSCCILDFRLPDGSAMSLLEKINQGNEQPKFPIVVSTAMGNVRLAVQLMKMGVQDYLVKDNLSGPELTHSLNNAMRTFELQTQLNILAHYDPLTGLLNRSMFMSRLEQAVVEAKRYGREVCLLYLDIDHFKQINDTYGHDVGDSLLKTVAVRIKESVRDSDTVCRLGGDEFVILLPEAQSHQGHFVAQKLLSQIPKPILVNQTQMQVSPSIGLANYPNTAKDHVELLKQADTALYKAKEQGRSRYVKFTLGNRDEMQRKNDYFKSIPIAIKDREIQLAYQPIFNRQFKQCEIVEALVRWKFEGQWVSPLDIVEVIQHHSLGIAYHEWLFNESFYQLKAWKSENKHLKLSINMSYRLCCSSIIIEMLFETIKKYELDNSDIIVEISEMNISNESRFDKKNIQVLIDGGLNVAIDNFGTGHTSMEHLGDLPCNILKIDRSFIDNSLKNNKHSKVAEALVELSHSLGIKVVAEGIESESHSLVANQIQCDYVQGFLLGNPVFGRRTLTEFLTESQSKDSPALFKSSTNLV